MVFTGICTDMYDDYDDGDWVYNGDAKHDMWVDYTTDMYEGTDYSGLSPTVKHSDVTSRMSIAQYESKIHRLEGLLAAAIAAAAVLDSKSANTTIPKNIKKFQYRANNKRDEASRYQAALDKLKAEYEPMKVRSELQRTRLIAIVCAAISIIAILIAIAF